MSKGGLAYVVSLVLGTMNLVCRGSVLVSVSKRYNLSSILLIAQSTTYLARVRRGATGQLLLPNLDGGSSVLLPPKMIIVHFVVKSCRHAIPGRKQHDWVEGFPNSIN
jgi:hypothetical protein